MGEKVAIVTGAARGLGKAFCGALLERNYKVYFCDVDTEEGLKTQKEFAETYGEKNVKFQKCDVRKEYEFTAFFNDVKQEFTSVNLIVNNAGIIHETEWRRCVDINLNGVIQRSMLAMEHMKKSNGGQGGLIINISSLAGILPAMFMPVYSATKSAIINFTRSWAMNPEIYKNEIRMACLCPAFADTDIIKNISDEKVQGKEIVIETMKRLKIMPVERITEAFVKLLDDTSNNGKVMMVTSDKMDYIAFPNPLDSTS